MLTYISDKFSHLSTRECIDLINKCLKKGGQLNVHSGKYQEMRLKH